MKMIVWFGFVLCALSAAGKVFITEVGKKVTLECGVNSYRERLVWNKGNDLIKEVNGRTGFTKKGNDEIVSRSIIRGQNLEILAVKGTDAGEFRCEPDGQTLTHTLVVISVSVVPSGDLKVGVEATLKCQLNHMDQRFTVKWQKPDGPVISEQTIQLKPVATSDGGTWQCIVTHEDKTYIAYQILTVKDSASKTTTPSSSTSSNKNKNPHQSESGQQPRDQVKHLGLEWWMWAALGAGCLVLILLIIFIIVMCKRVKRKKRKLQMIRHAQQLQRSKKYCQCERQTAAAKPQQGRRREKPSALAIQPLLTQ